MFEVASFRESMPRLTYRNQEPSTLGMFSLLGAIVVQGIQRNVLVAGYEVAMCRVPLTTRLLWQRRVQATLGDA